MDRRGPYADAYKYLDLVDLLSAKAFDSPFCLPRAVYLS